MSILIKGMEMPENCWDCPLQYDYICCSVMDDIELTDENEKKRDSNCPLEEVQETHDKRTETQACDLIDRQAAIDALTRKMVSIPTAGEKDLMGDVNRIRAEDISVIRRLPSAQPEHTCVNCGRTVNNGGWYADGRTRCPIEEHYALPKDGYCHLWEKRNVTDDDYPEKRGE